MPTPSGPLAGSPPTVRLLEGAPVAAAWGSRRLLAPFGVRTGAPGGLADAEVWFGAHTRHSARVVGDDGSFPASDLAPAHRPTFLVKLLAADAPLSIQVHPDGEVARAGFAAEERAGIPMDAPERRFSDPSGKPELLRALGPMRVLCGLRTAARSRALLSTVAPEGLGPLIDLLVQGDAGLPAAVAFLLCADRRERARLLSAVRAGAHELRDAAAGTAGDVGPVVDPDAVRLAELALDLTARFPDDAGTLVALLLEDVDLAPGESLFVAPGTPHAYLSGLGVEVMLASDNVLRGGMTEKHVDVDAFLAVLDGRAIGAPHVGRLPRRPDGTGWQRTILPSDVFLVDEARITAPLRVERSGAAPSIVLCLAGEVIVRADDGSGVSIAQGGAAILTTGIDPVEVRGDGHVLHVTRSESSLTEASGALTTG